MNETFAKQCLLHCPFLYSPITKVSKCLDYRNMPIKGASLNKDAPYSLEEPNAIINGQNRHSFLNNCPIFNPKPPLES